MNSCHSLCWWFQLNRYNYKSTNENDLAAKYGDFHILDLNSGNAEHLRHLRQSRAALCVGLQRVKTS